MSPRRSQHDPLEEMVREVSAFMQRIRLNRREHPTKTHEEIMEMSRRGAASDTEEEESDSPDEESASEAEEAANPDEEATSKATSKSAPKGKRKNTLKKSRKRKAATGEAAQQGLVDGEEPPRKVQRRRKTKEEKEAEAMPLAARSTGLRMFVGAHVSGAKGTSEAGHCRLRVARIDPDFNCPSRSAECSDQLRTYRVLYSPIPDDNFLVF